MDTAILETNGVVTMFREDEPAYYHPAEPGGLRIGKRRRGGSSRRSVSRRVAAYFGAGDLLALARALAVRSASMSASSSRGTDSLDRPWSGAEATAAVAARFLVLDDPTMKEGR